MASSRFVSSAFFTHGAEFTFHVAQPSSIGAQVPAVYLLVPDLSTYLANLVAYGFVSGPH